MKMMKNRPAKIIFTAIIILSVISLIPALILYVKPAKKFPTKKIIIDKLSKHDNRPFEFVVFGDNHNGLIYCDSATLKIIRSINREGRYQKLPLDFVMIVGDVTLSGSRWDYYVFKKIRSAIKWPVLSAFGNHDNDWPGGEKDFIKYAGEKEFSFADRNSYFITLDNSGGDLSDEQFSALESELKKSRDYTHRFVILHKPPISPAQLDWYRPELSAWPYRFMKLCEDYKVDIVFSGHVHMFREYTYKGVKYITTGGAGIIQPFIPVAEGGFLHYIVVRVSGDYVDYEVRKIFPPLWEYITYYMWKDILFFIYDTCVS